MFDYNNPEIKKRLEETVKKTGIPVEELKKMCNQMEGQMDENIEYVRITKGEHKGKVGYYFSDLFPTRTLPYSIVLYLPNGEGLMCNGWSYLDFEHITKEEYERECEKQ